MTKENKIYLGEQIVNVFQIAEELIKQKDSPEDVRRLAVALHQVYFEMRNIGNLWAFTRPHGGN